ncbi:MAG: tRNA lysidine(34) synthetase TilS [Candidatus Eremiobacteraeota bacterium]|nr:tRNA lysidine(34) synthetase TilS [Candidatus Eremiobacteraeota bacterium]
MRGAHPEREVERAVAASGVVRRGERVLIACSGGPDSVALTGAMQAVAKRLRLSVCAAFVNHGTRRSAWQDECVTLQIAAQLAIPLEIAAPRPDAHDEQALRTARYAALTDAATRLRCDAVATAHHAEDQSETVVLALLRGAGPAGLRGMQPRRRLVEGIDLVRPLLGVPAEALRAYCHARALPYAVDPTNAETSLRRNAVREALAALRPLFPGLDAAVARAAAVVSDEHAGTHRAKLRRSVREELARDDHLREIDFLHVEAAVRALEDGRTGLFQMKPGIALRIERGAIAGITRQ